MSKEISNLDHPAIVMRGDEGGKMTEFDIPADYTKITNGMRCRCVRMIRHGADFYCCNGTTTMPQETAADDRYCQSCDLGPSQTCSRQPCRGGSLTHVIYTRGRGYYRQNRAGYTDGVDQAGRYTALEAARETTLEPSNILALTVTEARALRLHPEHLLPPADPLEFRIERLALAPGDVLVVKMPPGSEGDSVQHARRVIMDAIEGSRADLLIVSHDTDLSVLTRAEIEERAR